MAIDRLILTGFMGVGKSTTGPKVAEALGIKYYDTDGWMETESGINVPNLVRTDMGAFRKLEAETLKHILGLEPGVISTGGGIVSTEIGRKALLTSDVPVIWLKASFEEAAEHVRKDTEGRERPLFDNIDAARALFDERQEWYQGTADYIVDASQPKDFVAGDIITIAKSE